MKNLQKTPVNIKLRSFRAVVFTMVTFVLLVLPAQAQQIRIGSGAHFVNGTNVTVTGDGIVNQGTLRNKATGVIKLTGNWQNDGNCSSETGSIVSLGGSATQIIGGSNPTVFGTLRLNNSAGFSLAQHTTVNGNLDFQNGVLATGNYLVAIGDTGTITNATSTKYVDGKLAIAFSSLGTKTFPTGKGGNYRPVTFQYTSLTGTSIVTAEQFETGLSGTLPANTTLLTTGRHWTIHQTGGSNMQYFVTLDATDYTPSKTVLMLKQDAGTMVSCATTAPDYTNSTAFTTFSDFGLGEACINPDNGGEIASDQAFCFVTVPATITSSSPPSGQTGDLQYKWQVSITDADNNFADIPDSDFTEYTPGTATQTSWYRRLARVTCASGDWATAAISNTVTISVYPVSVGGSIAGATSVCYGTNSTALNLGGYTGNVIKWQRSTDNWVTPVDVANTTNALLASDLTATTKYRAIVQSGVCDADTSADATVTVTPLSTPSVSIAITSGSNPVCTGNSVTFTATPVNGGTPPTYLWYLNGSLIAGGVSYTFIPVNGDQVYAVMESSLPCITDLQVTSATETMEVNDAVAIASVDIAAYGNPDHSVTYTTNPHNGGTPTYEWFKNGVSVGTGSTYTTSPVLSDEVYVVMYSSLICVVPVTSLTYCTH